jgi:hypothetical protein
MYRVIQWNVDLLKLWNIHFQKVLPISFKGHLEKISSFEYRCQGVPNIFEIFPSTK